MIQQDPSGIEDFVKLHYRVFAGAASTVFFAGIAVGRFLFDRAVTNLKSDADSYKNQRDEARRELTEAVGRVRDYEAADAATKESSITYEKERSTIKAFGRLATAMTAILIIAMLGYSIYLENTTAKVVLRDSAGNATFQDQTHQALQVLTAPKPVQAHTLDQSKAAKKKTINPPQPTVEQQ